MRKSTETNLFGSVRRPSTRSTPSGRGTTVAFGGLQLEEDEEVEDEPESMERQDTLHEVHHLGDTEADEERHAAAHALASGWAAPGCRTVTWPEAMIVVKLPHVDAKEGRVSERGEKMGERWVGRAEL